MGERIMEISLCYNSYRLRPTTDEEQLLLVRRNELFEEWLEETKTDGNKPHPLHNDEHTVYQQNYNIKLNG